jgi:DNA-binding HxlR family transcriptional regulator
MEERANTQTLFDIRYGSREILSLIAEKWTILVLYALSYGAKRHGELRREIPGISQKMLTQTLRSLERDGLVERKAYDEKPPRVEYTLTPLGEMLGELLKNICVWSEQHYDKILAARERYDHKLVAISL